MVSSLVTLIASHWGYLFALLGLGFAFGFGAVTQTHILDILKSPSGPGQANALRLTRGVLVLVAGSATESLGINAFPSNASVFLTRGAIGGMAGFLTASWNPATGVLTVTSANGADTSTVSYVIMA